MATRPTEDIRIGMSIEARQSPLESGNSEPQPRGSWNLLSLTGGEQPALKLAQRQDQQDDSVAFGTRLGGDRKAQLPTGGDSQPPREISRIQGALPVPPEQALDYWRSAGEFIDSHARTPLAAVKDALQTSRIVGLGETHEPFNNSFRKWGLENMPALRQAGMTHLAVEFPSILQPLLDRFNSSGQLTIPEHLNKADGSVDRSPAARGALNWLRSTKGLDEALGEPKWLDMLKAARDNGIKLVAIDKPDLYAPFANSSLTQSQRQAIAESLASPERTAERDRFMASRMMSIVDGKVAALPDKLQPVKIGAWLGTLHLADSFGTSQRPTAGELVRAQLALRGERFTSFYGQIPFSMSSQPPTMLEMARTPGAPAAVPTVDSSGRPNILGRIKENGAADAYLLRAWDQLLIFR